MSVFVQPSAAVPPVPSPEEDAAFEALAVRDPADIFAEWFAAARESERPNPEAAALATLGENGFPQVRTVLMKRFGADGFVFFTNAESRKGRALAARPRAALLFYWRELGRQASAEGAVEKIPRAETEGYFQTRPRGSRVGAWASSQSRPVARLADLHSAVAECERRFAGTDDIPPPPHWSGFRLSPTRMEFWREGPHRVHRRMEFTRDPGGPWRARLLQP